MPVPPPPPVSAVAVKFKTAVNPKNHKLEIVCASAICHSTFLLDAPSDESPDRMTALTLVRPVDFNADGAAPRFSRDAEKEITAAPEARTSPNERALLSRLPAQIGTWDPDVVVSHNGWGHDVDLLLSRCVFLKVGMWSKLGRRRQMRLPKASHFGNGNDWAIEEALEGRVLCDTCKSAKEFLVRETTYSLAELARTQLGVEDRAEIEPADVPAWCRTGRGVVGLARHTLNDAGLVMGLAFKLQALPLTWQLTCVAGNLWGRTMKSLRAQAERLPAAAQVPPAQVPGARDREAARRGGGQRGRDGGEGQVHVQRGTGPRAEEGTVRLLHPAVGFQQPVPLVDTGVQPVLHADGLVEDRFTGRCE